MNAADNPEYRHQPQLAEKSTSIYDQFIKALRKSAVDIPIVDSRAMYALTGEQTARIWMSDWRLHNDVGARNIANWIKDEIVGGNLLDGAEKIATPGANE